MYSYYFSFRNFGSRTRLGFLLFSSYKFVIEMHEIMKRNKNISFEVMEVDKANNLKN